MGRTTVNLIGNCVATVVIARWENKFDYYKMSDFIRNKKMKLATVSNIEDYKGENSDGTNENGV